MDTELPNFFEIDPVIEQNGISLILYSSTDIEFPAELGIIPFVLSNV
jgi:hypothetical protein